MTSIPKDIKAGYYGSAENVIETKRLILASSQLGYEVSLFTSNEPRESDCTKIFPLHFRTLPDNLVPAPMHRL